MKELNAILEQFSYAAGHPRAAMEEYRAKGRKLVGVLPLYTPEELIYAGGALPVGIWGSERPCDDALSQLPAFTCSVMQSVMSLQMRGEYDGLSTVVISVPCDTLKSMSQMWEAACPAIVFTHPQNRKMEAAGVFLSEEYRAIRAKLENILQVPITENAIRKSIGVYNQNRETVRAFCRIAASHPNIIHPSVRHDVMKARWFMDKADHTKLLVQLIDQLSKLPDNAYCGKRIVLTGIMAEPASFLEVFHQNGLYVVADDLAQESRQVRVDVKESGDPFYQLAQAWLNMTGCSVASDFHKERGELLAKLCRKYEADAVIVCMMKFCEPEEWDYPIYSRQLGEKGIPVLKLEIEQQSQVFHQVQTRIQSFSEILQVT